MVASFRDAVTHWLDVVLPADLYVARRDRPGRRRPRDLADQPAARPRAELPGVRRAEAQRVVAVAARSGAAGGRADRARRSTTRRRACRWPATLVDAPPGATAVYVSEAMVDLYGARAGHALPLPLPDGTRAPASSCAASGATTRASTAPIVIDARDWQRLTGDAAHQRPRALARARREHRRRRGRAAPARERARADGALLEFAAPREIRATSLRIFDRSFAVTYWLQAVAIAIGLFGIAASFSAQVLARRKEFGLLVAPRA